MNPGLTRRVPAIISVSVLIVLMAIAGWLVFQQVDTDEERGEAWAQSHPSIAATQTCTSCKAPLHGYEHLRPYRGACENCHTTLSWRSIHYIHEQQDFNESMHAAVGCPACHIEGEPNPAPDCQSCHITRSPHNTAGLACGQCHTAIAWPMHKGAPRGHFSLEGSHAPFPWLSPRDCVNCHGVMHGGLTACEDCHNPARGWLTVPPGFDHSAFFPLQGQHTKAQCGQCHPGGDFAGTSEACASCHGVEHPGLIACGRCHTPAGFVPSTFEHESYFAISGQHTTLDCINCHPTAVYNGTPTYCEGCHGVQHGGQTQCENCHTTAGFVPSSFVHATYFGITGKHTALGCPDCHKNGVFDGTPTYCSGCHGVKHGGLTACQDCHTTAGFVPSTFDHSAHFPITGRHREVACEQCHTNGVFDGTPTYCSGCHGVKHGGLTACQDCHTTAGFVPSTFDHSSVFELRGVHATLKCSKCHPGNEYANNIGGGSTECDACHDGPHGAEYTACATCHTTLSWRPSKPLAHPGEVNLGEEHGARPCELCHPKLRFSEPTTPCQVCHSQTVPHVGPLDCLRCHWPTTWSDQHFTHTYLPMHQGSTLNEHCLWCHPGRDYTKYDCKTCHVEYGIPWEDPF